ncbi:hypothetical protein GCM10022376_31090 [Yimella lutea]|nr:hypothetical protein [Yimella lutea]
MKETHDLLVAGARNDFLADAIAPLQGLSLRFWFSRVESAEIAMGSRLHAMMLQSVLDSDSDSAEKASLALNDYLAHAAGLTVECVGVVDVGHSP